METNYIIYFDIAAIVIVTATLFLFFVKKYFQSKANTAFIIMGNAILIASVLDIITSFTIPAFDRIPLWINYLLTVLYFLGEIFCIVTSLNYMIRLANVNSAKKVNFLFSLAALVTGIGMIAVILSPFLHTIFYFDPVAGYSRGFLYLLFYAVNGILFIFAFGIAVGLCYRFNMVQRIVMFLGIPILTLSGIVQYINEDFLLVNFVYALWWFMLFETMQNPAEFVDAKLGIFNSKAFYSILDTKIKKKKSFTVLVFELEGIQFVDQFMGVENGDELLKNVVQEISESRKDNLYYLEGTQFAYIFERGSQEITACSEWLKWRFLSVFRVNRVEVTLATRICAVNFPDVAANKEEIMNSIGFSLAQAKKNNVFDVVWATREGIESFQRQSMITHILKRAIRNREFEVFYQPIYSMRDNSFLAAEALIRLKDEKLGFISPDEFVPIAEKNGLILEIGDIVFEKVCEFISSGEVGIRGIQYIEVNLSVVQCMQEAMHKHLTEMMDRYEIPYNMIDFEITETFDISDNTVLINNMNRLIELGCTFAMDDYGTGFSNTNYLMEYPFKLIKLDKTFIWSAMENDKAMKILTHTVAMIKSLELKIVAEGVETKEQAEILMELGCDFLQGYYFSPPVNEMKYIQFIDEKAKVFIDEFLNWEDKRLERKSRVINLNEGKIALANAAAAKLSMEAKASKEAK